MFLSNHTLNGEENSCWKLCELSSVKLVLNVIIAVNMFSIALCSPVSIKPFHYYRFLLRFKRLIKLKIAFRHARPIIHPSNNEFTCFTTMTTMPTAASMEQKSCSFKGDLIIIFKLSLLSSVCIEIHLKVGLL